MHFYYKKLLLCFIYSHLVYRYCHLLDLSLCSNQEAFNLY